MGRPVTRRPAWQTLLLALLALLAAAPCLWLGCLVLYVGLPFWLLWGWLGFARSTPEELERGRAQAAATEAWLQQELRRRRMLDTPGNRAAVVMARPRKRRREEER